MLVSAGHRAATPTTGTTKPRPKANRRAPPQCAAPSSAPSPVTKAGPTSRRTSGRSGKTGGALLSTRVGGAGAGAGKHGGHSHPAALSSAAGSMINAAKRAATLARYTHSLASSRYSRTFPSTDTRNVAPRSSIWIDVFSWPGPRNREIKCSRGTSVTSSSQMASGRGQRLAPMTGSGAPCGPGLLLSLVDVPAVPCVSSAACTHPAIASSAAAMTHCCRHRHRLTPRRYPKRASWILLFRRTIAGSNQLLHEAITSHVPYRS